VTDEYRSPGVYGSERVSDKLLQLLETIHPLSNEDFSLRLEQGESWYPFN
jgi:hypothetical protein